MAMGQDEEGMEEDDRDSFFQRFNIYQDLEGEHV